MCGSCNDVGSVKVVHESKDEEFFGQAMRCSTSQAIEVEMTAGSLITVRAVVVILLGKDWKKLCTTWWLMGENMALCRLHSRARASADLLPDNEVLFTEYDISKISERQSEVKRQSSHEMPLVPKPQHAAVRKVMHGRT